ncbi:MAG: 2-hydroxychromene-2-carboxylate isomerase [Alphaproteobacteria bacterium]|nr:2-hydroxychromene-2-carboxylate isomerase [Alphaproteobacteria bacterium]
MTNRVDFFFDFGSPYAYCCLKDVIALPQKYDCAVVWHPFLLWTARKHFEMTPPMEDGPKALYMRQDIERSAEFHGVPFVLPQTFGKSTHSAARLFYGLQQAHPGLEIDFTAGVFAAHFGQGLDISDTAVLTKICMDLNIPADEAQDLLTAQTSRDALASANEQAVEQKVWGSPYFILKGESFFGADRLPQLDWRLAQQ